MPTVGIRNAESQNIGAADHLDVEDRNWGAEWYDSGFFSSNFIGAITVPFPATRHNSAPEVYVMASNILTITQDGIYFFNYTVVADSQDAIDQAFYAYLQQDPATGTFADVLSSYTSPAVNAGGIGTAHTNVILRVGANYRYRVQTASFGNNYQLVGSGVSALYGSRFSVIRLFKNG